MTRRKYSSAASQTALTNSIDNSQTAVVVDAVTGFPGSFPYELIIDQGTASEECILVTAGTGGSITVTRGFDGTTGLSHAAGATVVHGVSAIDFDEANSHVNETTTAHGLTLANLATKAGVEVLTNKDLTSATNTVSRTLVWTPVFTTLTVGNGTVTGTATQIGKLVFCQALFTLGSTSSLSGGSCGLTLPVTATASPLIGEATYNDGVTTYSGLVQLADTNTAGFHARGAGATFDVTRIVSSTVPFTWGTSDILKTSFWYVAA